MWPPAAQWLTAQTTLRCWAGGNPGLTSWERIEKEGSALPYSITLPQKSPLGRLQPLEASWPGPGYELCSSPQHTHTRCTEGSFEFTNHPFKSQALQAWGICWRLESELQARAMLLGQNFPLGVAEKRRLFLQLEPGQALGTASYWGVCGEGIVGWWVPLSSPGS